MYRVKNIFKLCRSFLSVGFLLSAIVLVMAATALRPGMAALSGYYRKQPVAIRRPLKQFNVSGLSSFRESWRFTSVDQPAEELGTEEFVYLNLTKKTGGAEPVLANLFVSYYSNPQDKVPHTPDVCYPGQGAVAKKMEAIMLDTPQLAPRYPQVPGRFIIFQWPERSEVVIYCFCAEGNFRDNREQVRWIIGMPGNRRTYFSLIKVGVFYPLNGDSAQAVEVCKTLLRETLAVLLSEHFPDKEQLKLRR